MTNDQEKLPVNSAANQCKLFFGSDNPSCRDDIRSLTNAPSKDQVYACITNNMQPVTKRLKINQKDPKLTKLEADVGGINTPFICSRDEKNLLSRTTTVTPSGKFFIANSYKNGKFHIQLFRHERLRMLIQDKGTSEEIDMTAFQEPIFVNAFGVNLSGSSGYNRKVRSMGKKKSGKEKLRTRKQKSNKISKTRKYNKFSNNPKMKNDDFKKFKKSFSQPELENATLEKKEEYLAPDPNEEIWLFLTERDTQLDKTVTRVVLLHTRQTGKEQDVWINYFKITAECQIASGLVLEVLVSIRRTSPTQFLTVFTNQDRSISGICVFNDNELHQKFKFNSNAKIIGKKVNGVDYIGHSDFVRRVKKLGTSQPNHNGDYFSEFFEPNMGQKQFLNKHRLLAGKLVKKSKWWAKLSVKEFAISPNFRDYMFLITHDNKLIRMQNIAKNPKAVEEIELTNFGDSNRYMIQPVKYLHVFESSIKNMQTRAVANVVVVKKNSYEIITFGEDSFCLKRCCSIDCCSKNEPFCKWDARNSKCRAGLKSNGNVLKVDFESIPGDVLMRKRKSDGFSPINDVELPSKGLMRPYKTHFSNLSSKTATPKISDLDQLFNNHRNVLQKELNFLDTPNEYSSSNQCPNWAVVSCLVEREYNSVWDRYKNIRDDLKDPSLQHKLSLKRKSVSDWDVLEENIKLWFGHIKKLLENAGSRNNRVTSDVILVSERVWGIMSTYMLSIGVECFNGRNKVSNFVKAPSGGQCGLKMVEKSDSYPEIDSCKISKITQLKAFLRADNSNPIINYNGQSNDGSGKQLGFPIEFAYQQNYLNLTFHFEQNPCEVPAASVDYLRSPRGHAVNYLVNEIFEEIINGIQNINSTFFHAKEAVEARRDHTKIWKTTVKSTEFTQFLVFLTF